MLLPSNPLTKALACGERRAGLEVFLADPDVPMDTNHLERALRSSFVTHDVRSCDQQLDESLGLNCAWYADILLTLTDPDACVEATAPPAQ